MLALLLLGAALVGGVSLRTPDSVSGLEVLGVARGAMTHMLPLRIAFQQVELGRTYGQFAYGIGTGTALAIRVGIGAQDRVLQFLLNTIPLLFWRF